MPDPARNADIPTRDAAPSMPSLPEITRTAWFHLCASCSRGGTHAATSVASIRYVSTSSVVSIPTSMTSMTPHNAGPLPKNMPILGAAKVTVRSAIKTPLLTEPSNAFRPLGTSTARTGTSNTIGGIHSP